MPVRVRAACVLVLLTRSRKSRARGPRSAGIVCPGCPRPRECEIITAPNPTDRHIQRGGQDQRLRPATDIIGTSTTSWEEAAAAAIREAGTSVRDLRVAEIVKQDIHVGDGGQLIYRTRIQLSFRYEQRRRPQRD